MSVKVGNERAVSRGVRAQCPKHNSSSSLSRTTAHDIWEYPTLHMNDLNVLWKALANVDTDLRTAERAPASACGVKSGIRLIRNCVRYSGTGCVFRKRVIGAPREPVAEYLHLPG